MPKLINYADRFEGIREAVYVLTLEKGVEAISLTAVAEWLQMSPRTVQRLLSSAEALPRLGMQWAEALNRRRLVNARRGATTLPRPERALDAILETMPGRADAPDRQVWWDLVRAHEATSDWARDAREQHDSFVADLSLEAVADVAAERRDHEARRLHLLVIGAITRICSGSCGYDDAAELIRRHVLEVPRTACDRATMPPDSDAARHHRPAPRAP
jgi:hypothetical protein